MPSSRSDPQQTNPSDSDFMWLLGTLKATDGWCVQKVALKVPFCEVFSSWQISNRQPGSNGPEISRLYNWKEAKIILQQVFHFVFKLLGARNCFWFYLFLLKVARGHAHDSWGTSSAASPHWQPCIAFIWRKSGTLNLLNPGHPAWGILWKIQDFLVTQEQKWGTRSH